MQSIKEIREYSGLTRAEFSRTYEIPVRTLEDWESGKRNAPSYVIKLLSKVILEDKEISSLDCYDGDVLKELGYCYTALLHAINKRGENPYPSAEIFPIKYFTMVHLQSMKIGIPKELHRRIGQLLNYLDSEQWANMMEVPVPMDKRQFFVMGQLEYNGIIGN